MQNEPMFQVQVDESEDTEWNDILRAKGIIPEKPPSPTAELEEALEEALAKQHENRLEGKNLSDLEELEDDEDDDFLEFYKRKRMAEIIKLQSKSKFGDVYHISKPDYNKEVTIASQNGKETKPNALMNDYIDNDNENNKQDEKQMEEGVYVFVHLSAQAKLQSRILDHIFQSAAPKYREIKFVEIPGNRAIENYPDSNCPTLLVYYNGDVLKNMVTLLELGGNSTTLKDFEELMVRVGSVEENDERLIINQDNDGDNDEERNSGLKNNSSNRHNKKTIRSGSNISDDEDDYEDDFFD